MQRGATFLLTGSTRLRVIHGKRISACNDREARPHDVYVYFDNDAKVRAPGDALSLERRLVRLGFASCPSIPARTAKASL